MTDDGNPRPDGVPEDWITVPCDNADCPYMTWVPNVFLDLPAGRVLRVCSAACAMALAESIAGGPSE